MDLTNILNSKEAAAAKVLTRTESVPIRRHSVHARPQTHSHSPPSSFSVLDHIPRSPASDHSISSTSYSIRSAPPTAISTSPYTTANSSLPLTAIPIVESQRAPRRILPGEPNPKTFPCSVCGKGFARRSDLARHERIHTGVRPHVCDYPGCNKQFIQRSALTVHARVHTGEKPHMCETCGKPFSDSSSLARHRRIHSGKRPYKCPYADCQKTFTRRTTLTRHQNHHTGSLSDAAAATAAALAARPTSARPSRPVVRPPDASNHQLYAPMIVSPVPRQATTVSPKGHGAMGLLNRSFIDQGNNTWHGSLEPNDVQIITPRPTPTTTPTIPSVLVPGDGNQPRRSQGSHYFPPLSHLSTHHQQPMSPQGSHGTPNPSSPPLATGSPGGLLQQSWQTHFHHDNNNNIHNQKHQQTSPSTYFHPLSPRISYQ